jgi:cytochrome P450
MIKSYLLTQKPGFMVWPVSHALHRSPDFWPSPESFIPERWLAKEGDPLFPVKGAWRPFEFGPRHCIGIELAMIETKVIMALMLRRFDTKAAYEELDKLEGGNRLRRTPDGERAYQVRIATAKPVDGMPVRVTRRSGL